ncbi:GDSL-type esterase/lipase family protein [Sphingomonas sp. 2R-10]|uniref:GDSL-type esterase/lipase family protein n=1 Tax=Sphingomonas sp. 2R-10 TaxID=3045148 RepID=UPI000F7AA220|nr:GDSL-type esterase/lipase family protein [Sphingomonas sp. 2R-10]MDJ0278165.1 GDSL-type esterase/lipase family protein [Sphingomonas sp. 2R-10]
MSSPPAKLPSALREIAMTLLKALIALGVFGAIVFGWGYSKAREQKAFTNSLPLPNEVRQDQCAVWFVGSSTMARWTDLQRDMQPWTTHNRAIGGATLAELTTRFLNERNPQPPRAIVFYAGENDLAFGVTVEATAAAFADFMAYKRKRLGTTPVFFVSVKPSPTRWALAGKQAAFDAIVQAMAGRDDDLIYVDVRDRFLVNGRPGPFYEGDGLHLNDAGYAIFSAALHRSLATDLPKALVRRCRRGSAQG